MTGSITGPDRAQPLPLYYQIYETLRAQLADGVWAAGEFLPPIPQLAARFSVSIVTIRQALELLRADGLVMSERGRGTSVVEVPAAHKGRKRRMHTIWLAKKGQYVSQHQKGKNK